MQRSWDTSVPCVRVEQSEGRRGRETARWDPTGPAGLLTVRTARAEEKQKCLLSRITLAAGLGPGCRGLWLRLTQLPALHHTLLPQAANPPQLSGRGASGDCLPCCWTPQPAHRARVSPSQLNPPSWETQLSRKSSSFSIRKT